ncbi:MAG: helix-turn-helix domain-containing protein [Candidatus Thermoplasmatota archaeon]|jgi:predicted DNA binding protein|nr:helix-turn-helix domain-containing protein [Candidatus Thermoplasmatota archaeon]
MFTPMCLKIVIRHYDCWSEIFSSYPTIVGELISQNVNRDKIEGTVAIYFQIQDQRIYYSFLKNLKEHPTVISVDNILTVKKGRVSLLRLSAEKSDSMSSFVYSNNMMAFKEFFKMGYEYWFFTGTNNNLQDIKNKISKIAEIRSIERIDALSCFSLFSYLGIRMENQQEELLSYLVDNGYLESKRRANLQQVAITLSTSKSNLSRKVREVERYLAYEYIKKIRYILDDSP